MTWIGRAQKSGVLGSVLMGGAAVGLAVILLTAMTRLRMYELRDSLQAFNEKKDDLRNVTLLSRISLINQRVLSSASGSGNRENAAAYRQEAESALIAIRQSRSRGLQVSLADRFALPVLNGFNAIVGLKGIYLGKTPEHELVLDLAFQFETYREYAKAIRGYDVYLNEFRLSQDERDFALLHRGFCRAMLSEFKPAIADFEQVAKNNHSRSSAIAKKLIDFLKTLEERVHFIESIADPGTRGELYYNAAAYLKALENFALIAQTQQSEKIRFLTARSLEETGKTKEALAIYRELISRPGGSVYAVNANRRIYLLGTFLGDDQALAQESKKNSETVVRDKEFMASVTHLEKSATKLHEEIAAERAEQKSEISKVEKLVLPDEPKKETVPPITANQADPVKALPAEPVKPPDPPVVKSVEVIPVQPAKAEARIDLKDEKTAEKAEGLAHAEKKELIKKQEEKIDKLTMVDGNIFYGVIYKEDAENVFVYSVLGNLELPKSNIQKREKIKGSSALK